MSKSRKKVGYLSHDQAQTNIHQTEFNSIYEYYNINRKNSQEFFKFERRVLFFMQEIWKDIDGYNGIYQISNLGRVKSIKRNIIRKPKKWKKGYLFVNLYQNGHVKNYAIHRLVANAFIPNPYNKPQVNHKDGNKENNKMANLEWCTNQENISHSWNNNLRTKQTLKGLYNYHKKSKKKIGQFDRNGNLIKVWNSISEAERKYGIVHISMCCQGKRKSAGGYVWKQIKE